MTLDPRLQELIDRDAIRQTLAEYCHACDRGDAELMAACYTGENSWDDHGLVKASGPEYARVMTARVVANTEAAAHILGQSLIRLDGDSAMAETAFVAFFRLPGGDGENPRTNQLVGRFVDRLERTDGKWKIRHRTCVRDTSFTELVSRDDYAAFGFAEGRRDRDDVGSAAIGIAHRRKN